MQSNKEKISTEEAGGMNLGVKLIFLH